MRDGVQVMQKGESIRGRLQFTGRRPCRVKKDTIENSLSPWDIKNGVDVDLTRITQTSCNPPDAPCFSSIL